jgi:hypothetical protein
MNYGLGWVCGSLDGRMGFGLVYMKIHGVNDSSRAICVLRMLTWDSVAQWHSVRSMSR